MGKLFCFFKLKQKLYISKRKEFFSKATATKIILTPIKNFQMLRKQVDEDDDEADEN